MARDTRLDAHDALEALTLKFAFLDYTRSTPKFRTPEWTLRLEPSSGGHKGDLRYATATLNYGSRELSAYGPERAVIEFAHEAALIVREFGA